MLTPDGQGGHARAVAAALALLRFADEATIDELIVQGAAEAMAVTGSRGAFLHLIAPGAPMPVTIASGSAGPLALDATMIDHVVAQRAPIARADDGPAGGDPDVGAQAAVPIFDGAAVVAVLGVGGRSESYSQLDLDVVALFGSIVWRGVRHRRLEAERAASQDRFDLLAGSVADGVVLVDPSGRIQFGNPAAVSLFALEPGELAGRAFVELVEPESLAHAESLVAAARDRRVGPFELDILPAHGAMRVVSVTAGPWADRLGARLGMWAILHDATDQLLEQQQLMLQQETLIAAQAQVLNLNEELVRSARTDALTGLGNRLRLAEEVARLQAADPADQATTSALMIDIDFFKRFNDRYGHLKGDEALKAVAGAIRQTLRGSDGVYRYGGEEMLVLLPGTPASTARAAADRVLRAVVDLAIPHRDNPPEGVVTVSIGVAVFDLSHTTIEHALREADAALYVAKELGRNRAVALAA